MGIFKAYDIRGIVPEDLDAAMARKIGIAAAHVLAAGKGTILVGRDMRPTGEELSVAVIDGLTAAGCDVIDMGLTSTPMNYYACGAWKVDGAIMVTASHNPGQYNGFKFCRADAVPVSNQTGIEKMEERVLSGDLPESKSKGSVSERPALDEFVQYILDFAGEIGPLKVAIDAGNGMQGMIVPCIFEKLPCEVVPLYFDLDGTFPNHEANPLKSENMVDLQKAVKDSGADVGIASDGDGDRVMFVDERAELVKADLITALLAQEVLRSAPGGAIIYDLRSSRAVPEAITEAGGEPIESRVGHSFMRAELRERGGPMGGELSGHYYWRENYYSDCAAMALVKLLELMTRTGKKVSELLAPLERYHATGEINFDVEDKAAKMKELEAEFPGGDVSHLDGVTIKFDDWWFNVRPSNTEPVLRLNLEADTAELRDEKRAAVEAVMTR